MTAERVFVIDTDTASLIFRFPGKFPELEKRIRFTPPENLYISIVTAEEMLRGAFDLIRQEEQKRSGTAGYALLQGLLRYLPNYQILLYDESADAIYRQMPAAVKRKGAKDCKIAATALKHGYIVVTLNAQHFSATGVQHEDWTLKNVL